MNHAKESTLKIILLALICLVIVMGCSKSAPSKIVGKWSDGTVNHSLEFSPDNTCILDGVSGKWKVLDDKNIQIEYVVFGTNMVTKLTVQDDKIIFPRPPTKAIIFEKVAAK